jgi:hypothetical protein
MAGDGRALKREVLILAALVLLTTLHPSVVRFHATIE